MTTPEGMPELPEPDGEIDITVIGRVVSVDAFRASTLKGYGKQCYEAGLAHGFKAGTDETIRALRYSKMLRSAI